MSVKWLGQDSIQEHGFHDAAAVLVCCDEERARCEGKAIHVLVDVSILDVRR